MRKLVSSVTSNLNCCFTVKGLPADRTLAQIQELVVTEMTLGWFVCFSFLEFLEGEGRFGGWEGKRYEVKSSIQVTH